MTVPPALRHDRAMSRARRRLTIACASCVAVAAVLGATGCAATAPADRARLASEAMRFDPDDGLQYLRLKMEAAREGSLGGYGDAMAGGCGCQ